MSKTGKTLLGIFSFVPIVLIAIYGIFFFSMFTSVFRESMQQSGPPVFLLANMGILQVTAALVVITALPLLIFYVAHAINNLRVDGGGRLMWVLGFVLFNVVAYPIYWFKYIRTAPAPGLYQS